MFVVQLAQLAASASQTSSDVLAKLASIVPHFDCRMGSYASWEEARGMLMWRAYDCSVNGVSDAVHQTPNSGKKVQSLGKREKIAWLFSQNKLPLPRHQAYGTVVARVRRLCDGYNPKTQQTTQVMRSVVEELPAAILQLAAAGVLDTQYLAAGATAYALPSHVDASHDDASHDDASHVGASHDDASHHDASHNDASQDQAGKTGQTGQTGK